MGAPFDSYERRLRELEELFEPPAGVSHTEFRTRLQEDEELRNAIYKRFEQGRASGKFPALSEFLSHLSVKERENFFKDRGSQAMLSPGGLLDDSRVRFRQLQHLLLRDSEFIARYPEAHEVLFPQSAGGGLPLPSLRIRVLRQQPFSDARLPQHGLKGDAYSITYYERKELASPPADQTFRPVDKGFLRGVLLAILGREEYSERIGPTFFDSDLFEGREVRSKSAVRITDLRLATELDPKDLDRVLLPALQSLESPVTAEHVVEWKHRRIGNNQEDDSDLLWDEFGDRINEIVLMKDQEAFDTLMEDMQEFTETREPDPLPALTEDELVSWVTEIGVASFAAAALLLFLDLDMPGVSNERPFRLAEQIKKLAALIRKLAGNLDGAANELGDLVANRTAGRQRRPKRDYYQALVYWRMGTSLEDIAEWWGIKPYDSKTVEGTRGWKKKVLNILAGGKQEENERYQRAAAIFANYEDSPHIRRKAHRAYRACLVQRVRIPGYPPYWEVGKRIRISPRKERSAEIIEAYIQLGSCLVRGRPVSP